MLFCGGFVILKIHSFLWRCGGSGVCVLCVLCSLYWEEDASLYCYGTLRYIVNEFSDWAWALCTSWWYLFTWSWLHERHLVWVCYTAILPVRTTRSFCYSCARVLLSLLMCLCWIFHFMPLHSSLLLFCQKKAWVN